MIKYIRRNQRMFLTGLTIVSMVMFVVSQKGNNGPQDRADPVYATVLGKPVHTSDLANAKAEMQAVAKFFRHPSPYQYGMSVSLLDDLFGRDADQIASKPEWFVMLRMEADAADIVVDKDEINEMVANHSKDPATDQPLEPGSDSYLATLAGVTDCMKIFQRYQQVKDAFKISKPERDHELAREDQTLEMNLVQFSAYDFLSKLPPPTTQQIQDQFSKFKDVTPKQPNPTTNPFGFGYKLPIRAKVQYLRLSRDAATAAVIKTKTPYDWEVAGRKYYLNNPSEFDLKPVTTGPTTMPSTAPATPQTFEQAHDKVLTAIRNPLIDEKMDAVQSYVNSTLNTDYQKYQHFCADGTGDEPDSSLGVRYSSFSYLARLSDAVQAKFGVTLSTNETDLLSLEKIAALPELGTGDAVEDAMKFMQQQIASFFDKQSKKDPAAAAAMMKPSQPLISRDSDEKTVNAVLFARMNDIEPAQAPSDVSVVQADVIKDLNLQAGYKLAQDQAATLATAARPAGLSAAAFAMSKPVIVLKDADAISAFSTDIKPIVPPLGEAAKSFTDQAYKMTGSYDPTNNPHPIQNIELPTQGRVFVAQLTGVKADWNSESYFRDVMMTQAQAGQAIDQTMRIGWFDFEAAKKRTSFMLK
jgi:hypothetical protein